LPDRDKITTLSSSERTHLPLHPDIATKASSEPCSSSGTNNTPANGSNPILVGPNLEETNLGHEVDFMPLPNPNTSCENPLPIGVDPLPIPQVVHFQPIIELNPTHNIMSQNLLDSTTHPSEPNPQIILSDSPLKRKSPSPSTNNDHDIDCLSPELHCKRLKKLNDTPSRFCLQVTPGNEANLSVTAVVSLSCVDESEIEELGSSKPTPPFQ
ncbi:hypothetical protein FCV25MIE_24469, partial [Fagus crenata]